MLSLEDLEQPCDTLQEPGVDVDDSRESQLLLYSPLQVISHLTYLPAPCFFFLQYR